MSRPPDRGISSPSASSSKSGSNGEGLSDMAISFSGIATAAVLFGSIRDGSSNCMTSGADCPLTIGDGVSRFSKKSGPIDIETFSRASSLSCSRASPSSCSSPFGEGAGEGGWAKGRSAMEES